MVTQVERIAPIVKLNLNLLKLSWYDYNDAKILVSETMSFEKTVANNFNKNEIFKNCIPFTDCINKINNAHADNATDIHIVMLIYNLIKYSNNY